MTSKLTELSLISDNFLDIINDTKDKWKQLRVKLFNQLAQQITNPQTIKEVLAPLHEASYQEGLFTGFHHGVQKGYQVSKDKQKDSNRILNEQNEALSKKNKQINRELDALSQYVLELVEINDQTRKIIRREMRAESTYIESKLPRMKPRTMVLPRYLSNDIHVDRVARRIEEFLADNRGIAKQEFIYDQLAPEYPASALNIALTHLLLSNKIEMTDSREWKLIRGKK